MGTWGPGPFDNDAAADFLAGLETSPSRSVGKALRAITKIPYIEVDEGGAAWAACELVALAFGQGDTSTLDDRILQIVAKLPPNEEQRLLALDILPLLADRTISELASLWHEGRDGAQFDAALAHLRKRMEAASDGPRELPKPKTGDVICFPLAPDSSDLVVVQVVGSGEVAVIEGTYPDQAAALESVTIRPARRVPTSVSELYGRGRVLGNVPVRKDLRGKKLYASETGSLGYYAVSTTNSGGIQIVSYEEARDHDLLRRYGEDAIRTIARGTQPVERVRSPDEREAELRARNITKWAARREVTTPGPFGDVAELETLVEWIEKYSIENAVEGPHAEAAGTRGYGRPNERDERRSFAFAGLVALWRKTWPPEMWPAALAGRLPAPPDDKLIAQALSAARVLADQVLTRDAELRLIWEGGPDQGAELREFVASLHEALG